MSACHFLIAQGMDESHAECVARAESEIRWSEHAPADHDAHVWNWVSAEFKRLTEAAFVRRRDEMRRL